MSKYGANVGDKVQVFFQNTYDRIEGVVKYMPQDTGDSWVIWAADGTIRHVQQFESIVVISRKAKETDVFGNDINKAKEG